MVFVADTHSLIWYLTADPKLGPQAKKIFNKLEKGKGKLIISLIVLLESLVIVEKRKIKTNWREFIRKLEKFPNTLFYPIGLDVLKEMEGFGQNLELHDRILVATAKIHKAKIITRDSQIKEIRGIKTIW